MLNKIMRVNMTNLSVSYEEVPKKYEFMGGRGLTSHIISEEVNPAAQALGPDNKLVFAPGLLIGGGVPCSGRLSVGSKSPLTGGIKESNAGGTAAMSIAKLGLKCIIVEGMPQEDQMYILKLDTKGVEFIPADKYKNMGNYDLSQELIKEYGDKISVMSIGPAGERQYEISSIAVSDIEGNPTRHSGRGGLGAVMGSKGIKAIVVDGSQGSYKVEIEDEEKQAKYKELLKEFATGVATRQKGQTTYGTAVLVNVVNKMGILPTRNFKYGSWDKAENISGEKLRETIIERGGNPAHMCHPGCVIRCSNVYNDAEGKYVTAGFEYETIVLLGSNLLIDDLDVIAQMDRFCDDFGIDTMDFGAAVGVAMEAGVLEFGDKEGVLGLRDRIRQGETLGSIIARGAAITGKAFGVKRVPTVKGQALAAYDPRGLKATGTTYATSPMGADHTAANVLPGRTGYSFENSVSPDVTKKEGQVGVSKEVQQMISVCDSLGLCFFVGANLPNCTLFAELISLRENVKYSVVDVIRMGEKILKTEYGFNKAAGITPAENDLPEFFRIEKLGEKELVFDVPKEDLANIWE